MFADFFSKSVDDCFSMLTIKERQSIETPVKPQPNSPSKDHLLLYIIPHIGFRHRSVCVELE
jgi:hypothetical protein